MRIEVEILKTPEMNKYAKRESYFCPGCDTEVANCNYCPHGQKIDWSKIVKQGSVSDASDNVCEWRCDAYERWHTECHILADNDPLEYTYCPYCGKKIKVVE